MKRVLLLSSLLLVLAILSVSCSSTLPARFERFVDKVAREAPKYTKEDWDATSQKFEKLSNQFEESYGRLTSSDKARITEAISRYKAIVFKSGVNEAVERAKRVAGRIGGFIKELGNGGSESQE